jgi:hypothetical protein
LNGNDWGQCIQGGANATLVAHADQINQIDMPDLNLPVADIEGQDAVLDLNLGPEEELEVMDPIIQADDHVSRQISS